MTIWTALCFFVILTTLLVSLILTHRHYRTKIAKLETLVTEQADAAFLDGFSKGWDDGHAAGERKKNLEWLLKLKDRSPSN